MKVYRITVLSDDNPRYIRTGNLVDTIERIVDDEGIATFEVEFLHEEVPGD